MYRTQGSLGFTSSLDLPSSPSTSGRWGYPMKFTTINALNDDILFGIFNYYRVDGKNAWNVRLGWCKVSHVCRRWRQLIHSLAFHLGMYIQCTNGTPTVDKLDHLSHLPLSIDYRDNISRQDELAIHHALLLCDRVRYIDLHLPPSILDKFIMRMEEPFSKLEYLSLSSPKKEDKGLILPETFLAPNLRHLTCSASIFQTFSSTVSLVTLDLMISRASGYFLPRLLVAHLRTLPHLEELIIEFSIPLPRPSAERELLGKQGTAVTLPSLKEFRFHGVSSYLECFIAQIRAPLLERLRITLFNQIAFVLPQLSHFIETTEMIKRFTATVFFGSDVSIILRHHHTMRSDDRPFILRVMCKELDWQIDCAAQICGALMPALSGVQSLWLDFDESVMPTKWENDGIDGTTWHDLLRSFIGVNELCVCGVLSQELHRALQVDEIGLDPGFLPCLKEIQVDGRRAENLFGPFIHARRVAGRPVFLTLSEGDRVRAARIRLAGRYLDSPEVVATAIRIEPSASGQIRVIITLELKMEDNNMGSVRATTPNEGRRRLAGRLLSNLDVHVITIRLEPGPSGRDQAHIILETTDIL